MRNTILTGILLVVLSLPAFAQADVSQSRWMGSGVKIDGTVAEWQKPLNLYDDESGLMFAIGNDKTNIYLCFTLREELRMKKLMSAGWTLEFTSKEKQKKCKAELIFPGINVMKFGRENDLFEKKSNANNLIKSYQLQLIEVLCKGFRSNMTMVKPNNTENINIAIGADSIQHIIYEIAIPLSELFEPALINLDEVITMNVTVHALERLSSGGGSGEVHSGNYGGGNHGGGGHGGGGHGGGSRGGMEGGSYGGGMSQNGGSYDRNSLFERVSFKQKIKLNKN
jgi:hypothetical protein